MAERKAPLIWEVQKQDAGLRLDIWLGKHLQNVSRSQIQKLIRNREVLVDSSPSHPRTILLPEQVVTLATATSLDRATQIRDSEDRLSKFKVSVLFEDDCVIVLNKPPLLVVHQGAGKELFTLVDWLKENSCSLSSINENLGRPGIVHRLDKSTTGAIICAKTDKAHQILAEQFKRKLAHRQYVALLNGLLPQRDQIRESLLVRDKQQRLRFQSLELTANIEPASKSANRGRYAKSRFMAEWKFGDRLTLAKVSLFTGRTHQVRVHSKDLGASIVGDRVYGKTAILPKTFSTETQDHIQNVPRQMLHAAELGFFHPQTQKFLQIQAPLPDDFSQILRLLKPYAEKV